MTQNETAAKATIASFYGMKPFRRGKALPRVNAASKEDSLQSALRCSTVDLLESSAGANFNERNEDLYSLLDLRNGPAEEPPFQRFQRPECV